MYASRTFAIVSSGAVLAAALLPAQQQPRAVIDPVRIMEARYEVAGPWWDPARGTPLAGPHRDHGADLVHELEHSILTGRGRRGRIHIRLTRFTESRRRRRQAVSLLDRRVISVDR